MEEPVKYKGIEGDKGLVVKNPAAHHAISAKFPKKIDNKDKTLVVQYEVKLQSKFTPTLALAVPCTTGRSEERRSADVLCFLQTAWSAAAPT